jgi:hypothetical protein
VEIKMNDMLITKEQLRKNACWQDKDTFITTLEFSEFPQGLLKAFSDLITEQDIADGGYLCCEYWVDEEYFVYNFNFEADTISVNEFFNKPLYNNIMIELSKEV